MTHWFFQSSSQASQAGSPAWMMLRSNLSGETKKWPITSGVVEARGAAGQHRHHRSASSIALPCPEKLFDVIILTCYALRFNGYSLVCPPLGPEEPAIPEELPAPDQRGQWV